TLLLVDARVELGGRYRHGAPARQGPWGTLRLLVELLADAVSRLLRDTKLDPRVLDLLGKRAHLADVVPAAGPQQSHVFQPESLHLGFRFAKLAFVVLDLIVDELTRAVGSAARPPQTLLDERGERGLDHVAGLASVGIAKRYRVDVVAAGAADAEGAERLVDQLRGVPAGRGIQIGFANDALDIRTGQQQPAEERHLAARVGSDRHAGHEWLQQRLCVHVNPRRRLVFVRKPEDHDGPDDGDEPRDREPDPATLPHSAADSDELLDKFLHGLSLGKALGFSRSVVRTSSAVRAGCRPASCRRWRRYR